MKSDNCDESYIFHITPYDITHLLPQVSKALEKRTELLSRERYPGMWQRIDRFSTASQGKRRSPLRTKIFSILCLAAGIFLLIPGLAEPQELLVPLLAGAAAVILGITGLWRSRKNRKTPFDRSARLLLEGKDQLPRALSPAVSFSDQGMTLSTGEVEPEFVPYSDFESAIETADTLLLVFGERVTLLQKQDLVKGDLYELSRLISEKVAKYESI